MLFERLLEPHLTVSPFLRSGPFVACVPGRVARAVGLTGDAWWVSTRRMGMSWDMVLVSVLELSIHRNGEVLGEFVQAFAPID
jgi:hypothetical protein